ncbi:hypothetical protein FHR75_004203 [Kineococcus radiotolerans]|uniref:Uncharacterized protein n=1 Tax=Kineococcus radiotolerans TaxID=131568 RepID=A0A7W4XYP1_KINRA|nr:ribosome-inactivating family protein [Kineococcus radiotolerans]MBB2903361.1 hypothetical protein [Kineococcus radiotolerans]
MAVLLVMIGLGVVPAPRAHADVPYGQVVEIDYNYSFGTGASQAAQYSQLIDNLRQTVAHDYRNGVRAIGTVGNNLVRLRMTNPNGVQVSLWIDPRNLYVLGFSNAHGDWEFNDDTGLRSRLYTLGQLGGGVSGGRLPFGSNYNSLTNAAGRGRDAMPLSYTDFVASAENLASYQGSGSSRDVARSLSFMIQMTSEAARFNDVYGTLYAAMFAGRPQNHLPLREQYLENQWSAISQYAGQVSQDPSTAPLTIPNGTASGERFASFDDVRRVIAVLLLHIDPLEPIGGNWGKTEL